MTQDQLVGKYLRLCAELRMVESQPTVSLATIGRLAADIEQTWDALRQFGVDPADMPPLVIPAES